ncbi:hypothetical protein Btru_030502 [Bulinus truncatus]|nr:hypothetical protein Btru_030502 [Bulinus truncatus]
MNVMVKRMFVGNIFSILFIFAFLSLTLVANQLVYGLDGLPSAVVNKQRQNLTLADFELGANDTLTPSNDTSTPSNDTKTPPIDVRRFPAKMDCEQRLLEEAYVCVTKHDIDFNHFLLMAVSTLNEGENVTQPAIIEGVDMTQFREKVCRPRKEIMQCTFKAAKALMVTPACVGQQSKSISRLSSQEPLINDQRYLIKEQMEAILGQYDTFCAQPCRLTLLDDMRSCYKKLGVDTSLFLTSKVNSPVIGSDSWEVDTFCKNRQELMTCLRKTRDGCTESGQVLSALRLDLDTMAKGLDVLCSHSDVYLKGIQCFENHPHQVGVCHSIKYRHVLKVAQKATELKWTSEKYFQEVCGVMVKHIECDLEAWAQNKDEKCDKSIVNLKRRLHCSLIHKQCESTHSDAIYSICDSPVQEFLFSESGSDRSTISFRTVTSLLLATFIATVINSKNRQ